MLMPSLETLRTLPVAELPAAAAALRCELIETVAQTGGHLGAGLGVVELTLALHRVFATPDDKLIWDVGHQSYPHKMLTGRRERMASLRQAGGLSGFTCRSESAFDPFGAAHSSTSVSAALGMATARDLAGATHRVACVIGDGAMSAGMAFEALNNVGAYAGPLVIVLNDNNLSIAPPVGALSTHLATVRAGAAPTFFQALGLAVIGPIDGHDFEALLPALTTARDAAMPTLVHVVTRKGKGYPPAENAADGGHAFGPFDPATGRPRVSAAPRAPEPPTYTRVFAQNLCQLAEQDSHVVAVTAAMPEGTGLSMFAQRFPERCFDVGIAEQHAVTFAAGLAASGMKPFVALYSTFLQRAYDQVVHDVALQALPVRLMIDRAGFVGADGPTHAGTFDTAFLECLPGSVLMAPADEGELAAAVYTSYGCTYSLSAVRYPRGAGVGVSVPTAPVPWPIGRGRVLRQGRETAIVAYGTRCAAALEAGTVLDATVVDARFAKPLDVDLLQQLADTHARLITVEDGVGFGQAVARALSQHPVPVQVLSAPDRFVPHASVAQQYAEAGIDAAGILRAARG